MPAFAGRDDPTRGSLRNFILGVALKRWRSEHRFCSLDAEPPRAKAHYDHLDAALAVAAALQALSPLQREAVILFEYEGRTLEETAAITHTEIGTVKSRLHRARESLRQTLAPLRPSLNNRELNEILREYNAPAAPATFNPARRQSRCRPLPWWRWLLTGTIRIPVPALLAITLAAIFLLTRKPNPQPNDLSKFQAVKQLNVRIIRSNYENH